MIAVIIFPAFLALITALPAQERLEDCQEACFEEAKQHMISFGIDVESDVLEDGAEKLYCETMNKMYECLKSRCKFGKFLMAEIRKGVDETGNPKCNDTQTGVQLWKSTPAPESLATCMEVCKKKSGDYVEENVWKFILGGNEDTLSCQALDVLYNCYRNRCQLSEYLIAAGKEASEKESGVPNCNDTTVVKDGAKQTRLELSTTSAPESLATCMEVCKKKSGDYIENHVWEHVLEGGNQDTLTCQALDVLYNCYRTRCELSEYLIAAGTEEFEKESRDVPKCNGTTVVKGSPKQTKLELFSSTEASEVSEDKDNDDKQVGALSSCVSTCNERVDDALSSIQPLTGMLTDVTVEEATLRTQTACSAIPKLRECMENDCEAGQKIMTEVQAKLDESGVLDMCTDEELQKDFIKCEVENKEKFISTCGRKPLEDFEKVTKTMPEVVQKIIDDPLSFLEPEVKGKFNDLCRHTAVVMECTTKVFRTECSQLVNNWVARSMSQATAMAPPEMLGIMGEDCQVMGETMKRIQDTLRFGD